MQRTRISAKQAFKPLDPDITEWKDAYTGETRKAAEPEEAPNKTGKYTSSREGIARRNAFWEGNVAKPSKKDLDLTEDDILQPEIIQTSTRTRLDDLRDAASYIGKAEHEAQVGETDEGQNTLRGTSVPNIQRAAALKHEKRENEKTATVLADVHQASEDVLLRIKRDIQVDKLGGKSMGEFAFNALQESMDFKDSKVQELMTDTLIRMTGGDLQSKSYTWESEAAKLALDILIERQTGLEGDTIAKQAQHEIDMYMKSALERELLSGIDFAAGLVHGREADELQRTQKVALEAHQSNRLAPDLQFVVKIAKQQDRYKQDAVLTEAVGRWALELISTTSALDKSAIKKSLKKDALVTLGKVTLQLLCAAEPAIQKGKARMTAQDVLMPEKVGAKGSENEHAGFLKPGVKSVAELFKEEGFAQDMQSMQEIPFNEPADIVLEMFSDVLKREFQGNNSDQMHQQSRIDVLSEFLEQENQARDNFSDKQLKRELEHHERRTADDITNILQTTSKKEGNSSISFKDDSVKEARATEAQDDLGATVTTKPSRKKENPFAQSALQLQNIDAEQTEQEGGKYAEVVLK